MKKQFLRLLLCAITLLISVAITGCASGPAFVDHAFEFDAINDSPEAEILAYRYGNSKQPGVRAPESTTDTGKVAQRSRTRGLMLRGDFLYVKWRIKETGFVFEDTVDFKSRLPRDITDHRIHFAVRGAQLFVYLVSPEGIKRPATWPQGPLRMYADLRVLTIYPDRQTQY